MSVTISDTLPLFSTKLEVFVDKTVRGSARTDRGNTRDGATKKCEISRTLLSINLHFLVHGWSRRWSLVSVIPRPGFLWPQEKIFHNPGPIFLTAYARSSATF